jgi:hypothetical protein
VLNAAEYALAVNRSRGDAIRHRLVELIIRFRKQIAEMGVSVSRSLFPAQALALDPRCDAVRLHSPLREAGVQTLLTRNRKASGLRLLFVFNASHEIGDVDHAAMLLEAAIRQSSRTKRRDDVAASGWTCDRSLKTFDSL